MKGMGDKCSREMKYGVKADLLGGGGGGAECTEPL